MLCDTLSLSVRESLLIKRVRQTNDRFFSPVVISNARNVKDGTGGAGVGHAVAGLISQNGLNRMCGRAATDCLF
jgi:hypothetical protein